MRVLIIGGTGLIGRYATLELLRRGHSVSVMARRPPSPESLPAEVEYVPGDLLEELEPRTFEGMDGVVFAAGTDYRVMPQGSALQFFRRLNQDGAVRFFRAAADAGVGRGVFVTSYYHAVRPSLAEVHPYIRVRLESEDAVLDAVGADQSVSIIQPPFILGHLPGRFSVGGTLARYARSGLPLLAPPGGTNFMAAMSLGEAIATALERGEAGVRYLVGDENLRWTALLERFAVATGRRTTALAVPLALWTTAAAGVAAFGLVSGRESGVVPIPWARFMARQFFYASTDAQQALGYRTGTIGQAILEICAAGG